MAEANIHSIRKPLADEARRDRLFDGELAFLDLEGAVQALHDLWFESGLCLEVSQHVDLSAVNYVIGRIQDETERSREALWPNGKA